MIVLLFFITLFITSFLYLFVSASLISLKISEFAPHNSILFYNGYESLFIGYSLVIYLVILFLSISLIGNKDKLSVLRNFIKSKFLVLLVLFTLVTLALFPNYSYADAKGIHHGITFHSTVDYKWSQITKVAIVTENYEGDLHFNFKITMKNNKTLYLDAYDNKKEGITQFIDYLDAHGITITKAKLSKTQVRAFHRNYSMEILSRVLSSSY